MHWPAFLLLGPSCAFLAALEVTPEPGLDVSGYIDRPEPGLSLDSGWRHDLRLTGGAAAPVRYAKVGSRTVHADSDYGAHVALQYVLSRAGGGLGWGLGLEAAYDDHIGEADRVDGVPASGSGVYARLQSLCLGIQPKLIVRESADTVPGDLQMEFGPFGAAGIGRSNAGGSRQADDVLVWSWGVRGDIILTSEHGWQYGVSAGYEYFTAEPAWDSADGLIRGHGPTLALIFGRRL
jgi:hypothetical protein